MKQPKETIINLKKWNAHMDLFDIPKDNQLRHRIILFVGDYLRKKVNPIVIEKQKVLDAIDELENGFGDVNAIKLKKELIKK